MLRDEYVIHIDVDTVVIGERREADASTVRRIAQSIKEIGLQHPITVRKVNEDVVLVAGRHRLEAARSVGMQTIQAHVVRWSKDRARMWEISENLHRAELTKLERAEQIEEWRELRASEVRKLSAPGSQPREAGIRKTADDLGVDEKEVRDAGRVAAIEPAAKEAARDAGLDDNRSALLKVASAPAGEQVARVHQLVNQRPASDPLNDLEANERQVARLMSAWNSASPDARKEFLLRIEEPVIDRKWG